MVILMKECAYVLEVFNFRWMVVVKILMNVNRIRTFVDLVPYVLIWLEATSVRVLSEAIHIMKDVWQIISVKDASWTVIAMRTKLVWKQNALILAWKKIAVVRMLYALFETIKKNAIVVHCFSVIHIQFVENLLNVYPTIIVREIWSACRIKNVVVPLDMNDKWITV